MKRALFTMSLGIVLAGCSVGPRYHRPKAYVPTQWQEAQSPYETSRYSSMAEWWTCFHDPLLNKLIASAINCNLDVLIAEARIIEARAQYRIDSSLLYPQLDFGAQLFREKLSQNQPGIPPHLLIPYNNLIVAGFDASWEIDIFGKYRSMAQAACADVQASIENRRDVLVTALAEVAQNYIELRGTQRQIDITKKNLHLQEESLKLVRAKFEWGLSSDFDVARVEAIVETTRSRIPPLIVSEKQTIHRIELLLGHNPGTLQALLCPERPIPQPPTAIPAGTPCDLIRRRPDIRRAERTIAATTARVRVAVATLYPDISLIGQLGQEGTFLSNFLEKASQFWTIGPSMTWPLYHGGQLSGNIQLRSAQECEAFLTFRKTVLTALEEVENALVAFNLEHPRYTYLKKAFQDNERAFSLGREQYEQGLTSLIDLLTIEQQLLDSETQLVQSQTRLSTSLVALYKALGGGWQCH